MHTRGERFFVQISPKFVVRQGSEESHPLRTPSYMPGGRIYLFPRRPRPEGSSDLFFTLDVTHHSNGQDGPVFNPDSTINYRDGNSRPTRYRWEGTSPARRISTKSAPSGRSSTSGTGVS